MQAEIGRLKQRMKHGPRLSRQMRAEFLLSTIGAGPRKLSPETLAKIRAELERLSQSSNVHVLRFVAAMRVRYPEVCP